MTATSPPRRPHPRHCRRRRNRRSAGGYRRGPRAAGLAGAGAAGAPKQDSGAQIAWRDRLARHRQFPELALSRSGKAACGAPRHRARRTPITARSAARARSAICTKRRNALRAANAASPRSAAPKRNRPRPRPSAPASTLPWTPFAHDVEEPKRGAAFQKPMAVKLGVFRPVTVYPFYEAATSAHWGQTPREAMAESGQLWSTYSTSPRKIPMPG